jgi:ferritin-like metal-binding protein YciE
MSQSEQKVVQYLNEAHATEVGLVRVLQSQIAMTPRGSHRAGLEKHLRETRTHAERVQTRLRELGSAGNPLLAGIGFMETALSQTLALWKAPLELMRGASGEEKVLKNAKDTCATEALEIATYTALEHRANAVGDETTAKLAASIRADEERMLDRVVRELPKLAQAVVGSEVHGKPADDIAETGAPGAAREPAPQTERVTRRATAGTKRPSRQAGKVPAAAWAEGQVKGVTASAADLAIGGYDELTAAEIVAKLAELSQIDLGTVDAYERKHEDRSTIRTRISALRGDEPWPGYEKLTAAEIVAKLPELSQIDLATVDAYERKHDDRSTIRTRVSALRGDEPWAGYDELTAAEIVAKLAERSQIDLAKVDAHERKHEDRSTIRTRISALRGDEPWPGYDELNVDEIHSAVGEADDEERASAVRDYERAHKNRAGVQDAVGREPAKA